MAVTLAQAALNADSDIDRAVIDEFRRGSYLMDAMPFDNVVAPQGPVLTYGYRRLVTRPSAATRAINAEYTPSEATTEVITTSLKVLGGSFQIDRVLNGIAAQAEYRTQLQQKILAARDLFHYLAINGDEGTDATQFDGLDNILAGSDTELNAGASNLDWRPSALATEAAAQSAMSVLDELIDAVDGGATAILTNRQGRLAIKNMGRRAGAFERTTTAFGQSVDAYAGVPIFDLGETASGYVIPNVTANVEDGVTSLYAVNLSTNGFHGLSMAGRPLVQTFTPDFSAPGAVKTGEVELVTSVALKRTRGAAVLRNVRVADANS